MTLPLARPLAYGDYPFVQPVRAGTGSIPTLDSPVSGANLHPQRVPLFDDLRILDCATFDASRLHPEVRRFYETPHRRMTVAALRWERWALGLALAYVPVAARLENLRVPDRVNTPTPMSSSVRRLTWPDGTSSREWVRCVAGTSQLFYVAALRPWSDGERSYLSMAFPFGPGHLMVLLRTREEAGELVFSTRDDSLAGTYAIIPRERAFVAFPGPPNDETLRATATTDGVAVVHEGHLGARRTFTMRYGIRGGRTVTAPHPETAGSPA